MKNLSIRSILWISYAFLSLVILFFILGYKVYDDITTFNDTIDSRISLLSQMIASNPEAKESILNNQIDPESKTLFEDVLANHPTIDLIVIANKNSIRIYHPIESMIGEKFVGGDEAPILENGVPYLSSAKGGTGNVQTRAFRAIYNGDEIIGFVMVSAYQKTIYNTIGGILLANLISFIIFSLVSFLVAYIMSKYIKNILLGNEPGQLRDLYIQQGNVLDSLNDSIIVTTTDNRLVYQNKVAFDMIETIYGESNLTNINDFIKNYLSPLAKYKNEKYHKELTLKNTVILVRTIHDNSKLYNIYTINNKSELSKLANELTGVNHALSSLRTMQTENDNKLHVILGLLQLKEYEEAMKFIVDEQIKDDVSTRNLLIVIGNLLENAFEALKDIKEPIIHIKLLTTLDSLTIEIIDNGPGIDPSIMNDIYNLNISSKGEQRGVGLYVVKNIIDSHHGKIDLESTTFGTRFNITINEQRQK